MEKRYTCRVSSIDRSITIACFTVTDFQMRCFLSDSSDKKRSFINIESIDEKRYCIPIKGVLVSFEKIS